MSDSSSITPSAMLSGNAITTPQSGCYFTTETFTACGTCVSGATVQLSLVNIAQSTLVDKQSATVNGTNWKRDFADYGFVADNNPHTLHMFVNGGTTPVATVNFNIGETGNPPCIPCLNVEPIEPMELP